MSLKKVGCEKDSHQPNPMDSFEKWNTECHSFKTLRFFQVIRLCSHRMTFMLITWKISSIFSTVIAHITGILRRILEFPEYNFLGFRCNDILSIKA